MSLVMLRLWLTGGFNGYGYMVSYIRVARETYWWILPFVNSQLFERVLADFARHWKVGSKKRMVLVVDGASGWHLK